MGWYFRASGDAEAAQILDWLEGLPDPASLTKRRSGFLGGWDVYQRQQALIAMDKAKIAASLEPLPACIRDMVDGEGIGQGPELDELIQVLTGRARDLVVRDSRRDLSIAETDTDLIIGLPVSLSVGLHTLREEDILSVAQKWLDLEAFSGWEPLEPEDLTPFLRDISELARRAHEHGDLLYIWHPI